MRATDYGPVALSQWKAQRPKIFQALKQGRRVLVAHQGEVVAVFEPATETPLDVFALYALPQIDTSPFEITATIMNQQKPTPKFWLDRAQSGEPSLVTSRGKLYGTLRALTSEELKQDLSVDVYRQRDKVVANFLAKHPNTTPEELATFTASLEDGAEDSSWDRDVSSFDEKVFGARLPSRKQRASVESSLYSKAFKRASYNTALPALRSMARG